MINPITFKAGLAYRNIKTNPSYSTGTPNPMSEKIDIDSASALSNYNQVIVKPKYDKDCVSILNKVRKLNNIAPYRLELPHSFNIEEINGERVYDKNGKIDYIREYENDVIREYYPEDGKLKKLVERNKSNGAVIAQIEPQNKNDGKVVTNVTIFDDKINDKYTIFQVEEDGFIKSVTEFTGNGKSFCTLFRNPDTTVPLRYLEAKDGEEGVFYLLDANFDQTGNIVGIKKTTADKEINITYEKGMKNIQVKQKTDV